MVNAKVIRQTKNDNLSSTIEQVERTRRRISRLERFGLIPEESAVRILGNILSIREELKACQVQSPQ